ncbi:hypothetical protein JCM10212_002454 [Sporobolomyces blumeae]
MTDDPHYLFRFAPSSSASLFDLVVSHEGPADDFNLTLRAFGNSKLSFEDGPPRLPYSSSLEGSWTGLTAGGNHTCSTFVYNPQYRVTLSPVPNRPLETGQVEVVAQTSRDSPINVKLVLAAGKRVGDFENRDVLAGTATYNYGRDACRATGVRPGSYTLVVSSFQPLHEAPFDVSIHSSLPLQVSPVPSEGAGSYIRSARGRWRDGLDGGSRDPLRNPAFNLIVSRSTIVQVRLQTPNGPVPIALDIYAATSNGDPGQRVLTTAPYLDLVCGVLTQRIRLEPNEQGYLILPSTYSSGVHASFALFVYADGPIELVPANP